MMRLEVVVAMGRRPVIVHGHAASLIGWSQRGGFGAIPPKWVGRLRGKAVTDQCI